MITFDTYKKVSGDGPEWICHCRENGNSRLVFSAETETEAIKSAKDFANSTLDTPERREILRLRAEARAKATKARKEKESAT